MEVHITDLHFQALLQAERYLPFPGHADYISEYSFEHFYSRIFILNFPNVARPDYRASCVKSEEKNRHLCANDSSGPSSPGHDHGSEEGQEN